MKKKIISAVLVAMLTVASLAGCGNTAAESTTAEGTASAQGTLVVGTNAAFPPFEYVGDDGQPDGFDIALIKAIGEKIGMDVQIQDMEFDSLVSSIGSKIDVAIAGMTVTEERQKTVDFSESYYEAVQSVIVPKGSSIASAEDLKNLKIGVQLGTTGEFIADEIEGAEVSAYNKAVDAVNDLNNNRVDCVIIDKNPAEVFGAQFADKVDVIPGTSFDFEPEFYAIALPKGNTDLANKINAAIQELKADGTYDSLVKQYIEE
ncbi:basic amino acid ABC transporter substrate-binding protein [Butyrivibrio sp. VCB2006]|uniref:basic amino acid ABC transporter substrate-binding protein n=1 Tax=Butyrivibrio sp. VCB2006 TaxID=1280679 RepID=UPI0004180448|nr:basic amino acid ABC transporter substrate-binding protein [Butyrivibrio sp. VCB2006]